MSLFGFFTRRSSAPVARERLQLLLAHERAASGQSDLIAVLREEILAVIAKHLSMERHKILVKMDHRETISTLEVDIEIPTASNVRIAPGSGSGALAAG